MLLNALRRLGLSGTELAAARCQTIRLKPLKIGPLLLREGCAVVQVPVRHRPRSHGTSHYNLWNRSLRVVADLFGVVWLSRREARYEIASVSDKQKHFEASADFQRTRREIRQEV